MGSGCPACESSGATKVGLSTQTKRGKALMAQVPAELLPYRFNDDGQRARPRRFIPDAPDVTAIPRAGQGHQGIDAGVVRPRSRTGELRQLDRP
jgi:hypothetical protein